jgi:two-component system, LytTR family, sensor kinase
MTLVENVMKHGDLTDPASPALITCRIDNEKRAICFSTVNKKANSKSDTGSGIGLANLVQRLTRLYGDKFSLTAHNEPLLFREELLVPFVEDKYPPVLIKRTLNVLPC